MPRPDPSVRERRVAAALFLLTCITVFLVHWLGWQDPSAGWRAGGRAMLFTAALMGILLAHELGHLLVARAHGFRLGWPWFLPVPFLVGTLGAVIRLREHPRTRTALLEMGAAGPLAGLLAALPVILAWAASSPDPAAPEGWGLHPPLLLHLAHLGLQGRWASVVDPTDPLGFAGWLGCLVTAMNLVPLGQLDGGHITAALAPDRARTWGWFATGALLALGLLWPVWALWAAALHLMGARHPVAVRSPGRPPSPRARLLAGLTALALLLCFSPVPVRGMGLLAG